MAGESAESLGDLRDYRELSRTLSYECLLTLTLLFRYNKLTKRRLAEVVGRLPRKLTNN